jgi:hypothetical protein
LSAVHALGTPPGPEYVVAFEEASGSNPLMEMMMKVWEA